MLGFDFNSLALAVIFGIGLFFMFLAFIVPKNARNKIYSDGKGTRIGSVAEKQVFQAIAIDISRKINPEPGDLEERLRRSGYVYKSVADYHARRMLYALSFMLTGVVLGFVLELDFLLVAIVSTAMMYYGFTNPKRVITKTIQKRRSKLLREMGFGMERVALALGSGSDIALALGGASRLGLFGEACGNLASSLNTQRPIDEAIDEIRSGLPKTSQLDEFLQLVRMGILEGQNITDSFKASAKAMRNKLSQELIETGHNTKLRITIITSTLGMISTMVITLGAGLAIMMETM